MYLYKDTPLNVAMKMKREDILEYYLVVACDGPIEVLPSVVNKAIQDKVEE